MQCAARRAGDVCCGARRERRVSKACLAGWRCGCSSAHERAFAPRGGSHRRRARATSASGGSGVFVAEASALHRPPVGAANASSSRGRGVSGSALRPSAVASGLMRSDGSVVMAGLAAPAMARWRAAVGGDESASESRERNTAPRSSLGAGTKQADTRTAAPERRTRGRWRGLGRGPRKQVGPSCAPFRSSAPRLRHLRHLKMAKKTAPEYSVRGRALLA